MKSAEIRKAFLNFFAEQGHEVVPSSPLVPGNDPTLLFTNAGMVQFKDVFTGRESRSQRRAASSQRCVRAGGKHNDLENVGYTARHHTFFEMLGNFSFGDYFKADAIRFAWSFLTERLGIAPQRLWVTVHDSDDEAEGIWINEIGVPAERVTRLGDKDNFWAMGDTGPCGPCSEIFFDHGPEVAGGPPGSPDEDGDRYVEIWNLVFMQYERAADGTLSALPRPSVDTGMGLERIAAVMQGVHSNYDIDLFRNLIAAVAEVTAVQDASAAQQASLRVIADHIRAAAFLITDGVMPGNEGRGYVLRRIIRRALRHGHKLGCDQVFFHRLVKPLQAEMGDAYPELVRAAERVEQLLLQEEEQFARTLGTGMDVFEQEVKQLAGRTIPGEVVFRLYDTYGFPVDLTADIARERELELDMAGFEAAMAEQRERARAASRFAAHDTVQLDVDQAAVEFTGYEQFSHDARVEALFCKTDHGLEPVDSLRLNEEGVVVLDRTPFYAESGGQVGDTGSIEQPAGRFAVTDTQPGSGQHLHYGRVTEGRISVNEAATAAVDRARRARVARNHSATHLLHAALREVLGPHVEQKGSLVAAERLRFDFAHPQPLSAQELSAIEARVNEQILANSAVGVDHMGFEAARERGAMALFGEKYGDEVRVLSMGDDAFSVELCGGTHVERTGDIGLFHIVAEQGIASGVRRIEAVTGDNMLAWLDRNERLVRRVAEQLRAAPEEVDRKVAALLEQQRRLEKELAQLQGKLAAAQGDELAADVVEVNGVKVLARRLEGADPKGMLKTLDQLKNKLQNAVIVLATVQDGKVALIAGVSAELTARYRAGDLVKWVGEQVGARGGGRPDMARAGGGDRPEALPDALARVPDWVREQG